MILKNQIQESNSNTFDLSSVGRGNRRAAYLTFDPMPDARGG